MIPVAHPFHEERERGLDTRFQFNHTAASIVPWARKNQDCCAGLIAGAARDGVVPADLIFATIKCSQENESTVAALDCKGHGRAHDEAAGRKLSGGDRPRGKAGCVERDFSADRKATFRIRAGALSLVAGHAERSSPGSRECAVQHVRDVGYCTAGDASVVAFGTSAAYDISSSESAVAETAGESDDLSRHRRGSQGDIPVRQSALQADDNHAIKAS